MLYAVQLTTIFFVLAHFKGTTILYQCDEKALFIALLLLLYLSVLFQYLNKYLDICRALEDNVGIGKACEAIAKSYERYALKAYQ